MKRDRIIKTLAEHHDQLRHRFGVKSLALFGSVARSEASEASDVDLLVEFDRPVSLFGLAALRQHLEKLLKVERVDLTLADSVYPALQETIFGEAIHVCGEKMEIPH